MEPDQFYCLKCGRLIGLERASSLFRTGYFRIVYRLGCCADCEQAPASETNIAFSDAKEAENDHVFHVKFS